MHEEMNDQLLVKTRKNWIIYVTWIDPFVDALKEHIYRVKYMQANDGNFQKKNSLKKKLFVTLQVDDD